MHRSWGWLVAACLAGAGQAQAGTIYRCDSADGGRAYVSKRVSGAKCVVVSSFQPSRSSSPRVPAWVPPASSSPSGGSGGGDDAVPASVHGNPPATFMGGDGAAAVAAPATAPARPASSGSAPRRVQGQVYSYVQDGVRHYTSRPPPGGARATAVRTIKYSFLETCYACGAAPRVNFGTLRLNTTAFDTEVKSAAREFGVDEAVIRAIMHAESAYNPNALSRVGAQGLMQLMPATAKRFGVTNAFDPQQNIRGGVQYLAWLLKRFNGNLTLAAAGYNAGEGAVDRHKGVPPYSETRRYVERVAVLAERYRGHAGAN